MPRTSYRKIHLGTYVSCPFCDYQINNNRVAMRLHKKMSHPNLVAVKKTQNILRCIVCKKPNCLMH